MADVDPEVAAGQPKKRTFKKFSFRGVDLDALLDMSTDDLVKLLSARARRRSEEEANGFDQEAAQGRTWSIHYF
ncbi:hypothetical protein ACS0TY_030157 [Phlomoides rotata]